MEIRLIKKNLNKGLRGSCANPTFKQDGSNTWTQLVVPNLSLGHIRYVEREREAV